MIKVTYQQLSSFTLQHAVQKLGQLQLPAKTAYNVQKLIRAVESAKQQIRTAYQKDIIDVYAILDENKQPKVTPEGELVVNDADKDAFKAAYEGFGTREMMIDRYKLNVEELGDVRISATELEALAPFFFELDVVPVAPTVSKIGVESAKSPA